MEKELKNRCYFFNTAKTLAQFGANWAPSLKSGAVLFLEGPLGAGKTTFVRGLLHGLGWQNKVKSPSFALMESYDIGGLSIFHFDFYRIEGGEGVDHLGLEDCFFPGSICLIEWPEKGPAWLPVPDVSCQLDFHLSGRKMAMSPYTEHGRKAVGPLLAAKKKGP